MAEESGDRRALALCEHALSLNVNANDWTDLGGGARIGHWQNVRFRATLLEPSAATTEVVYSPYVLEIWDFDETVLSAHWDDPKDINVRLVKSGNWQMDFLETS
jgi:hypothetical protein